MTRYQGISARAFTPVEALTAVAVIALSASIVFPTLAKAKEPARRAMCADNMHHLMAGVLSYANDHAGKGPFRGWFSYTISEDYQQALGHGGTTAKTLVNLGLLYKKWIGGQHDVLYCPSTYATFRDDPSSGWTTAFKAPPQNTVGSYNYALPVVGRAGKSPIFLGPNPFPPEIWSAGFTDWTNDVNKAEGKGWHALTGRPMSEQFQVPSSPALAFDMFVGNVKPVHSPGVNVLYPDGHVRFHDIGGFYTTSGEPRQFDAWYKLSMRQ